MKGKIKPKVVWDYELHTDRIIKYQRSDIHFKTENKSQIVDVAISFDYSITSKQTERMRNYSDLKVVFA